MKLPIKSSHFIRSTFFEYFIKHDHKFIKSSPVVPFCDPTLSFVNAGMNQFKNVLLGNQLPLHPKVVNSQKCIRVGGKHNDLSSVGHDTYHHTFFEMLGNWSFGDYFKETACKMAWNFLTTSPISIAPNRLYVTYFNGDESLGLPPDLETKEIWLSIGVDKERVLPFGVKDNFWEMGLTGPCGPCTEIHYDYCQGTNSANLVNKGFQDVVELWNLVFVEYKRMEDGSLKSLPMQHIDTGMGFERFVAILQETSSNYNTDLFTGIFDTISKVTGAPLYSDKYGPADTNELNTAYRIIADHMRMCTVALADNMFPDQNHKLRRILRKALWIAENDFKAKSDYTLLQEISNRVSDSLSSTYPEIGDNIKKIHYIIENESEIIKELKRNTVKEWRKIVTKDQRLQGVFTGIEAVGLPAAYNELVASIGTDSNSSGNRMDIDPDLALRLYDTYGLDAELIEQLAQALGCQFSREKFMDRLTAFKFERTTKSALKSNFNLDYYINELVKLKIPVTDDIHKYAYSRSVLEYKNVTHVFPELKARVQAVMFLEGSNENESVRKQGDNIVLKNGERVAVVFKNTNFYSAAGGQASDSGEVRFIDKTNNIVGVLNVDKLLKHRGFILHIGKMKISNSSSSKQDGVTSAEKENTLNFTIGGSDISTILKVDEKRLSNMQNHTATHLLNGLLRQLLTVTYQKSSNVNSDHLIFDFGIYKDELTVKDYIELENAVNRLIKAKLHVIRNIITRDEFLALKDVTLVPGEVYSNEKISLIEISNNDRSFVSKEPCCGTHVDNTSDLDEFRLISVKNKGRNIKSLKAVTGVNAKITTKNDTLIQDQIKHYSDQLNSLASRSDIISNEHLLDDLNVQLQNLKNAIITSVDKKYFSYAVYHNSLEAIDKCCRDIRIIGRGILKEKLKAEMNEVIKGLNEANIKNPDYKCLVHFIQSSSNLDVLSLQKVAKMCPSNIPIMLFSYSETDNMLKGRCCIPEHMVNNLSANEWMTTVSKLINSKESNIVGENPKIVCNMKPKWMRKENVKDTVDKLVEKAEASVKAAFK